VKITFFGIGVLLSVLVAFSPRATIAGDVIPPSLDTPYDQWTWLAAHNAYANPDEGFNESSANQLHSITDQLNYGVRVINPDVWLVRQELVGNRLLGTCKCEFEEYPGASTAVRHNRFKGLPVEVVVAHGDDDSLFGAFLQYCTKYKTFTDVLTEIHQWVLAHPQEVITLVLENKVHNDPANQARVEKAFRDSGLQENIFYPDRANPAVPAPEARAGGWSVSQYGYPTLRQLVEAHKTVVRAVDLDLWHYEVSTVYGRACLDPRTWTDHRSESWPPNDFTRRTFAMIHVPDLPVEVDYAYPTVNSISVLRQKLDDVTTRWNRLPNSVWVDYYDKGESVSLSSPAGPAEFVNEVNAIWKSLPPITPVAQVVPAPTAYGWNNTDVHATLSGTGDSIQAITSRTFGADSTGPTPTADDAYTITNEGVTTISFSAVGDLGNRSATKLVNVAIDKTPPIITGSLDRPPDRNGWYSSNVTAHFECSDSRSGVASCPGDVVISSEGANQTVTGTATDLAGNQSTTIIENINLDKTGPEIRTSANPSFLWPPNGKLVPVVIRGTMTDAGSGVDPATTSFAVTDEYRRIQPSGRVSIGSGGAFSLTVRLESQRTGGDKDGRSYVVRLNARDRVGHSTQAAITVLVPHDSR
jgi:hypothetical protein